MGGLLHLVQERGAWAGWGPAQSSPRCIKCNSPPINGQCTNFILFDCFADCSLNLTLIVLFWKIAFLGVGYHNPETELTCNLAHNVQMDDSVFRNFNDFCSVL